MRKVIIAGVAGVVVIGIAGAALVSCDRNEPTKAQKAAAKRAKEAELLALPYPASTGTQPKTMEISYDGAANRTSMTLRLTGLRVGGAGASGISSATLHLTSSHKGRVRAADDPEGSVDGGFLVQTSSPGALAFSGTPGTVTAGGRSMPLKPADADGYVSTKAGGGQEEAVRFKWDTRDLVAAATSEAVSMSFGTVQVDLSGQPLTDLREFAARMNPKK